MKHIIILILIIIKTHQMTTLYKQKLHKHTRVYIQQHSAYEPRKMNVSTVS